VEEREKAISDQMIPVIEEVAEVSKRTRVTGTVTMEKQVEVSQVEISEVLQRRDVSLLRVPKDIVVDAANPPQARTENGVTIIPVLEEVLVVEKRLMLREELHIRHETPSTQTITLKSEIVVVKRDEFALSGESAVDE
jgi:stress response protein YsnF